MTKLRAYTISALVCGTALLSIGTARADVFNYVINPGSFQSAVDNTCVGALPGATGEDCTYNQADATWDLDWGSPIFAYVGPVRASGYYAEGNSPFANNPNESPLPQSTERPDPDVVALEVSGTLRFDDPDPDTCDTDIMIEGQFAIAGGTRTFNGGPGSWAEETWSNGTIVYDMPPTEPNFANVVSGGCEYIFGSQGFPPLITTVGGQTYPVDTDIISNEGSVSPPGLDAWDTAANKAANPNDVGVAQFEGEDFIGNFGFEVTLNDAALAAGSYRCSHNNGGNPNDAGSDNPVTGDNCNFSEAAEGTPCDDAGSNFCGARRVQENWVMRFVVDAEGNITEDALIFANNESIVFATNPAPDRNNSWDGPLITFTASCIDCAVANNDSYTFVTTPTPTITLNIGENDDLNGDLEAACGAGNTVLAIDSGPGIGLCEPTSDFGPGAPGDFFCDFSADFTTDFFTTFDYSLDCATPPPADSDLNLDATVEIDVVPDIIPVTNDLTGADQIELSTKGVAPGSLSVTLDVFSGGDIAGNQEGNNPTLSATDGARGTVDFKPDGSTVTYGPADDYFTSTDSFTYTIDDDNFMTPGNEVPQSDTGTIDVNIENEVPAFPNIPDLSDSPVEEGQTVSFSADVELGNGSAEQHVGTIDCEEGDAVIDDISDNGDGTAVVEIDYTAPSDFEGELTCTFTATDEDGNGETAEGVVTITIIGSTIEIKYPGSGNALGPWGLLILVFLPLLRTGRTRRGPDLTAMHNLESNT